MNYCLNSNNQTLKPHSNPPPLPFILYYWLVVYLSVM